jgi:hypothetical protein
MRSTAVLSLNVFFVFLALCAVDAQWVSAGQFDAMEEQFADELKTQLDGLESVNPDPQPEESSWNFSRIQVLTGAFAEIDLKVIEIKVQPYMELRFNRR